MTKRLSAILRLVLTGLSLTCLVGEGYAADFPLHNDRGGNLGEYMKKFKGVAASGDRVIISGKCMSACTLVLSVVPREQICAMEGAELVFHAVVDDKTKTLSQVGNDALLSVLAPDVKSWIIKNNAFADLKPHYLRGAELDAFVKHC